MKRRKNSLRLPDYDYSLPGAYFITLCTQHRLHLFGHISDGKMILNDAGRMVQDWLLELEHKFSTVSVGEYVVMPNHVHVVVFLKGGHIGPPGQHAYPTGQNIDQSEQRIGFHGHNRVRHVGLTQHVKKLGINPCDNQPGADRCVGPNGPKNPNPSIPQIMQWFKTMTTNEYIRHVKNDH